MNARKMAARRVARDRDRDSERRSESRPAAQPVSEAAFRELQVILDQEVNRLPEKYRAPFVLCCLEGNSKAEAARELGWKEGTVSGRLAEARKRLRQRLARRGVSLTAALCALAVVPPCPSIAAAAVRAALSFAAGNAAAVSAGAAALAEGVHRAMFVNRLKLCVGLVVLLGALAAGVGLVVRPAPAAPPAAPPVAHLQISSSPLEGTAKPQAAVHGQGELERKTEEAAWSGLEWLARHQGPGGNWSMRHFHQHAACDCGGRGSADDIAATAFGLLPLLGAGETHKGTGPLHPFARNVQRGLLFLVEQQKPDGGFGVMMYSHALATLALCEAYQRTRDPWLKQPAKRAVDYIVKGQDAGGGWRYQPGGGPGDTSITVWQILALKRGQAAGLEVPAQTWKRASGFLDSVGTADGSKYGYISSDVPTPTMTAAGLLSRLQLGWAPTHKSIKAGVEMTRKTPQGPARRNLYHLFFVTILLERVGGAEWKAWEPKMRRLLLDQQDRGNDPGHRHQKGSWSPEAGGFDNAGGRVMVTSLALLTLQSCSRSDAPFRPRPRPREFQAGEAEALWEDLAGAEFVTVRRAMQALFAAPAQSVAFLGKHLKPVADVDAARIARLVSELDSKQFPMRQKASVELARYGDLAVPALRQALAKQPPLEVRRRIEQVLAIVEKQAQSGERLRPLRALEVLVQIGGTEAREVVKRLAAGAPPATLTQAAREALKRMKNRPAEQP
jgi:hypothetical protein